MTGSQFYPLCAWNRELTAQRFLRIDFDEAGTLRAFKVYKSLEAIRAGLPQLTEHPSMPAHPGPPPQTPGQEWPTTRP